MNDNLKSILKDACISHQEISEELGIKSLGTVSLKVNGKAEFWASEAVINNKTGKDYKFEDLFSSNDN